jgi:hypothetical protein
MKRFVVASWVLTVLVVAGVTAGVSPRPVQPGGAISHPLLDAHNCYPDDGQWTDRLARALGTHQAQIGVEQDLVWKPDGQF